jgi:hypothetical protein
MSCFLAQILRISIMLVTSRNGPQRKNNSSVLLFQIAVKQIFLFRSGYSVTAVSLAIVALQRAYLPYYIHPFLQGKLFQTFELKCKVKSLAVQP